MIAERRRVADDAVAEAKAKLTAVSEGLRAVRKALGEPGVYYAGDPETLMRNLRSQARQTASQLDTLKDQLAAMVPPDHSDEIAAWQSAVAANEARLAILDSQLKAGAGASAAEVEAQRARLAEARARLAAAKAPRPETPVRTYSPHQVPNLTRQIRDLEARLKEQQEQLAALSSPEVAGKLATYREQVEEEQRLRMALSQLTQQAGMQPHVPTGVTITVLDGR